MNATSSFRHLLTAAAVLTILVPHPGAAETLESALIYAYRNNPQLNAERAALRAVDESVPQALADYRPRVSATADLGAQYNNEKGRSGERKKIATIPRGVGLTASQTLLNGFQTGNRVRTAENQVLAARESLRVMEQMVLLDAAAAYMDVMRDGAIVEFQLRNVQVLDAEVSETRDRLSAGQGSATDVAQSQSRLAAARFQLLTAQASLYGSRANYERVIGLEPGRLSPASPVDRLLPAKLDLAIAVARAENPSIVAAMYGADIALLQTKIAEGALYPSLMLEANVQRRFDAFPMTDVGFPASVFQASVVSRVTVPIYQGGGEYAAIRQSKEVAGRKRFDLESVRKQARASVIRSWWLLDSAKAQIEAAKLQVSAAELAFTGMRDEARSGQRRTLDLLNAQQELVNARVVNVGAQRDRVLASYSALAAVGRLSPQVLGLAVETYDPAVHYHQVRDVWAGVRTPDGR
jgi:outer membrane protein